MSKAAAACLPLLLIAALWVAASRAGISAAESMDDFPAGLVPAIVRADTAMLIAEIRALTAPELAGRGAGTEEERRAAAIIAAWFEAAGLAPAFAESWFQTVPLPPSYDGSSINVAGVVPGSGSLADRWILAGAHLDHLGRVDPYARGVPEPGDYYPGAGDNAAGVAAILHVARAAAGAGADLDARRALLVCAFGAEEIGLLGSSHLAANLPMPADRLDAMVNLDAVGGLGKGPLHVGGVESCPDFADIVSSAAGGDVHLALQSAALVNSDHASFLARDIPSLFLFTGPYVEMNSPADSLPAVDVPGLVRVAEAAARLVDELRRVPGPLVFSGPGVSVPSRVEGDRRTWFGTAPDFSDTEAEGYRIGGLTEGGPAAVAGLRVGDLLVAMAGAPVSDLASFTGALRSHAPGDVIEVEIERQGRRLFFLVTLGSRDHRLR